MVINIINLISVLFAGIALGILLTFPVGRSYNSSFILLFSTIFMVNFSYFVLGVSTTVESAALASAFTCFDATMMSLFLILCMVTVCNIRVKDWIVSAGFICSTAMQTLIFTSEKNHLFTESTEIVRIDGYTRAFRTPGPLYPLFIAMLVIYFSIAIAILVYAFLHRKHISYKYTVLLSLSLFLSIGGFILESVISLKVEILPYIYNVMELVVLYVYVLLDNHDVDKSVMFNNDKLQERAYILFDERVHYLGSNLLAQSLFPELLELTVDRRPNEEFVVNEFLKMIEEYACGNKMVKFYNRNGKDIRCTVQPYLNPYTSGTRGFIIEGTDETAALENMRQLDELNSQLSVAIQEANSANQAKSDFLSNMSHEIRTPINAVLGMNEMILRESEDKDILSYAKDIQSSGQMLLALINDILDFSKIASGKMELICQDYHLSSVLHNVSNMIQSKAGEKCLAFRQDFSDTLPEVLYGDETRIQQIIINLLTNAVKYTDTGTVTLKVTADEMPDYYHPISPNGFEGKKILLHIAVSDTGRGISDENKPKLFSAFSRVDEAKNKGIEGTGLGLSITHRFTEMMGGNIEIESTYGKGSTFTVHIPMCVINDTPMTLAKPGGEEETSTSSAKSGKKLLPTLSFPDSRILVVDDVKVNLRLVQQLLKHCELNIDTAESGQAAINLCKEYKYDLIMMDHMMPGMDGIEAFHRIQTDEDSLNREVPTVMLTANAIAGVSEEYMNEGFSDYLSKPFSPKQLENTIRKFLEK